MPIRAQKTDALVPVQIHSEYRRIIEAGKPAQLEQFSTFRLSTAVVENTQEMALRGPINCAPLGLLPHGPACRQRNRALSISHRPASKRMPSARINLPILRLAAPIFSASRFVVRTSSEGL